MPTPPGGSWQSDCAYCVNRRRRIDTLDGCACGIGLLSLVFGVAAMNQTDPSGVSGMTAVIVKAAMVSLGFVGLAGALRGPETE